MFSTDPLAELFHLPDSYTGSVAVAAAAAGAATVASIDGYGRARCFLSRHRLSSTELRQ